MRFITLLRRLDNTHKDRLVLISSLFLTISIAVGGFFYTNSSWYKKNSSEELATSTSSISSLVQDIKTTIVPTVKDMQANISSISDEYKKGSFKDLFVPKSE